MNEKGPARRHKKERNRVAAHTPKSLRRSAMNYVERYECSISGFISVLRRKIYQSSLLHKINVEELYEEIPSIVQEFQNNNWSNDERFAENRARALFRDGASLQAIRFKLIEKGIPANLAEQTIETLADETELSKSDIDLAAAISYAQKRRIGPFRLNNDAEENKDKDLGALARRGFSFEIASKVLSTAKEELEEFIENFKQL